jgi:ABC-type Fe3+-siderophore transport system permease subunit
VGLLAPHMARRLVGARHALLLPTAGFIGALLVLVADALGRGALAPLEIPAGLITAIIGAPYFLYLLMRTT